MMQAMDIPGSIIMNGAQIVQVVLSSPDEGQVD